jgi:hypothetical protein
MNRFARPAAAVQSMEQIPVGTRVWYVYGVYPPQAGKEQEVASEAYMSEHGHSLFFKVAYLKDDGNYEKGFNGDVLTSDHSLMDANIDGDNPYNDNYFFLSKEDADRCVLWFKLLYDLNPPLVEQENERHRMFDDYWTDYDNSYYEND